MAVVAESVQAQIDVLARSAEITCELVRVVPFPMRRHAAAAVSA